MLLQTVFILALGGSSVAAKFGRKNHLPWSWLYSAENCTAQHPDNNQARAEWSLEIDISNKNPWENESPEFKDGAWRRSLWLPARRDTTDGYSGNWCFSMYESTDGYGDGEEATVVISDEASCWNFDAEYPSEQPKDKRRSREWEPRHQQRDNNGETGNDNGGNSDDDDSNNDNSGNDDNSGNNDSVGNNGNNDNGGNNDDSGNSGSNNSSDNKSNDNQKGNGNNDQSSDDDQSSGDVGNSIPKTDGKPIRGKGQFKSFRFKQVR